MKAILYAYPGGADCEKAAVEAAIHNTERMRDGVQRLRVIDLVFFKRTHKLAGAALNIPCSYETAKRWQRQFIRDVARNFRCEGLLKD